MLMCTHRQMHIQTHTARMSVWPCVFICPHKYKSVHVQHTCGSAHKIVHIHMHTYPLVCVPMCRCLCTLHMQEHACTFHAHFCTCVHVSVCIQMCPSQPLCHLPICKLLDSDASVNSERRNTIRGNTPPTYDGPIQALGIA